MKRVIDRTISPTISATRPLTTLIVGQAISALMALIYGKLTALYIPPAEWGDYSLLVAAMTLLHGFLVTPTNQSFKTALARFPRRQVIRFYSRILLLIYLTVVLTAALLAGLYYQNSVFGLVWLAAFGQVIYQLGNDYLNVSGQHRRYVLIQIAYAISNVLTLFVFVVGFNQQTSTGVWQSMALLNSLFSILAYWHLDQASRTAEFLSEAVTDLVELSQAYKQYVGPLLSLAFWGWVINYADRYLIRLYLADAGVGQYVMGYSLGSKLLILVAPFLTFLSPKILSLRATGQPSASANPLLLRYLAQYVLLAGTGCFLFYLGREWIGELLLSNRYRAAFPIGPIVAIGYLFLTSIHLLEVKWYAFGQTRLVLWHNIAGAVLNVTFTSLLIPRLGILGAALATLAGFAGQFLLAIWLFLSARYNGYETLPPDTLTLRSL
ncbi:lipopolysaccharide biosynthesis protein [Spirosoma validum]|uniref:Polysaccharide biosynthesis C-terminal domain-containing protein n=1 Tax=Spirosoma validum TaxID=2771355 RepID=A0A927AX22_9BACT|nr:polysaccharide biosynthesis C-terminal domain-containing protein [Spirosoma validum]MBD2751379.1 polysaccharide biosynthesis C-terminal domain-containing protein [Spirosoma validum]